MELQKTQNGPAAFDRNLAFSRNLGFVTRSELDILKNKTVAIAGMGGAGGAHLLTLARLGVGGFHIADMDRFSIENFNRQVGATVETVGRTKVEVMEEMVRAINPEVRIQTFPEGVNEENADLFFSGVDAYADGLDFFAFSARQTVFRHCQQHRIPACIVGPIGMGAALVNILPGQMSFEDYFQWKEQDSDLDRGVKFLIGLTPKAPHRSYLVDPSMLNLKEQKGPSTPMCIQLCAGVLGSEILKMLLKRGKVLGAPHSILFDAYLNRLFHCYMPFGNRNPLQRLKFRAVKRFINSQAYSSNPR